MASWPSRRARRACWSGSRPARACSARSAARRAAPRPRASATRAASATRSGRSGRRPRPRRRTQRATATATSSQCSRARAAPSSRRCGRADRLPRPARRPVVEPGRLLPRQAAVGGDGRPLAPGGGDGPVAERRRRVPMAGQLGTLVVAGALVGLDRVGHLPVGAGQVGRAQRGLDGIADQGVDEAEAPRRLGRFDEAGGDGLVESRRGR